MKKPYFNDAVAGNSRILACLTSGGEIIRLYWPNIDRIQHIDKLVCGIFTPEHGYTTSWLGSLDWQHRQSYKSDTNILQTLYTSSSKGLKITQTDFALIEIDVYMRRYIIENISEKSILPGFIIYSSCMPLQRGILFDFTCDALIHYGHDCYISISGSRSAYQFQLGGDAYGSATRFELRGCDSIGMMRDGAVSWMLDRIEPGETTVLDIYICFSHTLRGVKQLAASIKNDSSALQEERTSKYWINYLRKARRISTGNEIMDRLYRRSLLVFKLMSDEKTGGLLAAPEVDEDFTRCGGYAYCWPRDAAFITGALDASGLNEAVEKFYQWAVHAQDESGCWHQRYYVDGNLAPSWGLQIDETGTILWGMLKHYEATGDRTFLTRVWDSVKKGVSFLMNFIDEETGLPAPSFDIWEERFGEHAYSAAAVYGGLMAAADIGAILDADKELTECWRKFALSIKDAILRTFWSEEHGRFIRSVRTKLNPWGEEHSERTVKIKVNPKGCYRDVTLEDDTVDVSLLGLVVPFGVIDADDERMRKTVETIEKALISPISGGIKRYENDGYIGGNPWILATLWLALYYIRLKNYNKAKLYFEWSINCRTDLDFLPEQADRESGRPAWVTPLTWSHAMFVLVLVELYNAGVI